MFLTFFLSLTLPIFLRTILRPQQDDVKGPTGGTVSDTTPPCPDAQSRRAWSKGMHNGGLQARMGEIEVSRWDSSSACSAARINQRPRVCPRGWRKRERRKMPPASIGMRRELPTENDKAQLTNARRSIRSRYTNPEWSLRL